MAELNDKLITYGNLSTFYDKLQEQDCIEEVSELPEASENKNKLFRLDNGEKDVYAAKLLSSETITTNRLPDEQQIDKAYLCKTNNDIYYYKGTYKIICSDTEFNCYFWQYIGYTNGYATLYNAENVKTTSEVFYVGDDENYTEVTENYAKTNLTFNEFRSAMFFTLDGLSVTPIPAIYNAPESAQIGNAYLLERDNGYNGVYNGTQVTFIDTDGSGEEVTGYKWIVDGETDYIATSKPASEIYFYYDVDNEVYYLDTTIWVVHPDDNNSSEISGLNANAGSLYIPQLNAPDSEQVGNAYVDNGVDTDLEYYNGIRKTIVVSDGSLYVYLWGGNASTPGLWDYATTVPANEIYGNEKVVLASLDDYTWTASGDTLTNLEISLTDIEENHIVPIGDDGEIISTVKYHRTETTEEWDWEKVATEQYIDDAIANINTGVQYDESLNALSAPFNGDETLKYILSISYNSEGFVNECDTPNLYFWDDSFVWYEVGEEYGRDYDFSGLKIYHNGTPVATINVNCYSGGELAFNILEGGNPFVEGEEYYISSSHLKHPLTNKDEVALGKATISHEGKTLLSVGGGSSSGDNIIEVTNDGGVYVKYIGNYYGNEDSLSNKKSLQVVIGEKVNKTDIPYSISSTNIKRFFNLFSENSISNGCTYCYSEGNGNTIQNNAYCVHIEGKNNDAGSTMYTHIEGCANEVKNLSEHAEGYANVSHKASNSYGNAGNTQHSIGIDGSGVGKNAFEIMQNGDMYVYGIGGYQGTDTTVQDSTIKTLQAYIASLEARIAALEGNTAAS